VSVDVDSVNHDPAVWARPDTFDPDRFLSPTRPDVQRLFHRFGLGARNCLGKYVI
jgi:cytochrome P450